MTKIPYEPVYAARGLAVFQVPIFQDNYVYILRDELADATAVVDPGSAAPIQDVLDRAVWPLQTIYNTHHHADHVGGNEALREHYACEIIASTYDQARIPGITRTVEHGETLHFGVHRIQVIATPGHTLGHIVYYWPEHELLFCGDTLFGLGCGRLFEGSASQMWASLQQIAALPDQTLVFCAHEYTLSNARFAASLAIFREGFDLYLEELHLKRSRSLPTVPSRLAAEKRWNPFLQAHDPAWAAHLGHAAGDAVTVFADLRQRKDQFR